MELRRRKKEEEKVSTENKIKEVKVSETETRSGKDSEAILYLEVNQECGGMEGEKCLPAGNDSPILRGSRNVHCWRILLLQASKNKSMQH